jgi:RND family efflux transporter MFP subunit
MILLSRQQAVADIPEPQSEERALPVECVRVQTSDVPVTIEGFGEARARRRVNIAPEVPGVISFTHDSLLVGGLISSGELILAIDSEPYFVTVSQAAAKVGERVTVIERLTTEWENDRERLHSLERRRDLAQHQFDRLNELHDDDVGTQEGIDFAEQAYVIAQDETDQLGHRIALYPIRIDEARNALAMAQADLEAAKIRLSKTELRAPFDARVSEYSVETGQFIQAGQSAAVLVDDSIIEIATPLDSREAREWLRFTANETSPTSKAWFGEVEQVQCEISWTEAQHEQTWTGYLDRVAEFDEESRTVTVIIRVAGENASRRLGGLPLVEGMYCRVEIPGTTLQGVMAIPDSAVTVDGSVYCVNEERIQTRPVNIVRRTEGMTYIDEGLSPGDEIITTRLINPLDRTLVRPTLIASPDQS